ncbi:hypothetical protein Plhal304r1_c015g0056301 [Plasmopara halstedii]
MTTASIKKYRVQTMYQNGHTNGHCASITILEHCAGTSNINMEANACVEYLIKLHLCTCAHSCIPFVHIGPPIYSAYGPIFFFGPL